MKFHIVLHQPRIPQNTGNIGRLCFATDSVLHLIHPLGFTLSQKELKRAGLDYWKDLEVYEWQDLESFCLTCKSDRPHFYFTTKAQNLYWDAQLQGGAYLHFGREDAGLSVEILERYAQSCYRIPMCNDARSLNLATSVGIVLYEGLRQCHLL